MRFSKIEEAQLAIKPFTLLNGTVADANEVEAIFLPLYIDMAPINVDIPNKLGTGRFVLESALTDATTPIGTIVAFYDFNGVATFDLTIWNYCDGAVINSPGSPIDGQTLPDLSGRYICGFGTDGGGDIGTAPFSATPVGNANSETDLTHTHTVDNHSHTVNNHSHTIGLDGVHAHGALTGVISNDDGFGGAEQAIVDDDGNVKLDHHFAIDANINNFEGQHRHIIGNDGNHSHSGATGNTSPGTSAVGLVTNDPSPSLAAINIQPISIRVRFIMKVN